MKAISAGQAKAIDIRASKQLGMSALVMMENAGIRIAEFALGVLKKKKNKSTAVICGKGNNAGDGLVISRQLICAGIRVDTFLLAPGNSLSPAARKNLHSLKKITRRVYQVRNQRDLSRIDFSSYGLLVDAIFGIGLRGQVNGIFKSVIRQINLSGKTIISVDIPSGLDANQGLVLGTAVKADYTFTLIAPKKGLFINQGGKFSGKVIVNHIGFPLA